MHQNDSETLVCLSVRLSKANVARLDAVVEKRNRKPGYGASRQKVLAALVLDGLDDLERPR